MDSLYLSFQGELSLPVELKLIERKQLAQSRDKADQARAQFYLGSHTFEVRAGRDRLFPHVLEDGAFRISLASSDSRKLPFAFVKVSADYLAHHTPEAAVEELTPLLDELAGQYERIPSVSRIDLFADFQTGVDLGEIRREAWISRAGAVDAYSRNNQFTGWVIGSGGAISARLYDKTLEIAQKGHKPYLHELWQRAGRDPERPVWRLEFQLRGEVLKELGIRSFRSLMDNLGGAWGYAAQSWLRLSEPMPQDSNRGRWPTHPLWTQLAEIRWRLDDVPLTRSYAPVRIPSEERLLRMTMSLLQSFMAVHGITELDGGMRAFWDRCEMFHRLRCEDRLGISLEEWVESEVRIKGRLYNTLRNRPSAQEEATRSDDIARDAIDYDRASRGE